MRRVMVVAACALALAGCATMTRGSSEQLQFDSQPVGAEVRSTILPMCDEQCAANANAGVDRVSNVQSDKPRPGPSCVTPCVATVARHDVLAVTFSKPGYEPQTVRVTPQIAQRGAVGVAGNALAGGVTGIVIDAASGAALDHCPNPVVVVLRRTGSRDPNVAPNLQCTPAPIHDPNGPVAERSPNY